MKALLGAGVMAVALGVGPVLGAAAAELLGATGFAARMLPALFVTAIAVPLVLLLARGDRARIGLRGGGFGLGAAVVGGSAVVTFGLGTVAGLIRWGELDPAALVGFLLTDTVVALLLEALPEELTLRGYAFGVLRRRFRAVRAGALTTGLFLLVPAAASGVRAVCTGEPAGLVPAGEDPVAYLVLLGFFGVMLVAARTATGSAGIWTCVGAHLMFLTVNRVVLFGADRHAGWSAELTSPDAVLLVPVYLVLATAAFVLLGRRARKGVPGAGKGAGTERVLAIRGVT
ncbi:hypothetical protein GCM10010172_70560 [Paractinoplanes ferrugineus]|uniref:CAAX prenyl protease 2/Lysostaphin resistance protein A-like domain-containing protein n=1 Tax=Paractinoplanes ferrugineus TaxID=113564 RepID=A0A919J2Y9_9ACTN|nr:CPBP family glutamic-type intramembrane protease [Actinoplanes ferrugineus]GIE12427.1 hypothetical protein Afe05nite_42670 [Actinoplanes ferrugineus]